MIVNGFDLVDLGQKLGIGGLGAERARNEHGNKQDCGSFGHKQNVS
jgi:hypothetical protein